jgi:hypothetical protein
MTTIATAPYPSLITASYRSNAMNGFLTTESGAMYCISPSGGLTSLPPSLPLVGFLGWRRHRLSLTMHQAVPVHKVSRVSRIKISFNQTDQYFLSDKSNSLAKSLQMYRTTTSSSSCLERYVEKSKLVTVPGEEIMIWG